jgi:anti-sigma factor RsiW
MNCNTCRFELSQCLDGRLPSGRRTLVMEHAAACTECGTFWAELQAAQRLTLQLQRPRVSAEFRDALWQRIQAGEGTPEAVFREPVPMLAKLRYGASGAAAAAAALLCITWLTPKDGSPMSQQSASEQLVARSTPTESPRPAMIATTGGSGTGSQGNGMWHQAAPPIDQAPLFSSTERLTFNLFAVEAAKQLDRRHAAATIALRRLDENQAGEGVAVQQVLENADEFQVFAELLLDLRERKQLYFIDSDVEPDLRFAVNTLGLSKHAARNLQTVQTIVAPALRSSRLASVSRTLLTPPLDEHTEVEVLRRLNSQRPDVFPKLFIVMHRDGMNADFGLPAGVLFPDDCGPSLVAPRSEVEARDARLRIFRSHRSTGAAGESIEVQIQVRGSR